MYGGLTSDFFAPVVQMKFPKLLGYKYLNENQRISDMQFKDACANCGRENIFPVHNVNFRKKVYTKKKSGHFSFFQRVAMKNKNSRNKNSVIFKNPKDNLIHFENFQKSLFRHQNIGFFLIVFF